MKMIICAAAALLLATPVVAQEAEAPPPEPAFKLSGGATLASQYRFRGISLSDEKAAIQGTINLNHESGFYGGFWASSIDGWGELGGSNVELDLYGGWKGEVTKGITLDAGLLYYAYPGSTGGDFEFFEPYANVSGAVGPVTLKVGGAFAPSQDALGNESNLYLFSDASLAIPGTPVTLGAHLGRSKGDTALSPGGKYLDWSLSASAAWRNLTFTAAYVDTNINSAEALSVGATKDIVDSAIVLSVGASF